MTVGLAVGLAGTAALVVLMRRVSPPERGPLSAADARGGRGHLRRSRPSRTARASWRSSSPGLRSVTSTPVQAADRALPHVAREPRRDRRLRRARPDGRASPSSSTTASGSTGSCSRSCSPSSPARSRRAAARSVRLRIGEQVFVAWGGLKGAVPILLAAFCILAGVEDARRVYEIVFVVVPSRSSSRARACRSSLRVSACPCAPRARERARSLPRPARGTRRRRSTT